MRYKKYQFFNIISSILSLLLVWQNIIYAYPAPRDLLRVPVGEKKTYKRMSEKAKTMRLNDSKYYEDAHYQRMDKSASQYTKAIYEPEWVLSNALAKLNNIIGLNILDDNGSTIVVVGFGENWQELTLLSHRFPKCKIVGIDWLNRNIEEAKKHIEGRNIDLIQDDIGNVNLEKYPPVSLIYMSYVIDDKLYDDDAVAMNKIIEKSISLLDKGGFIVSVPANYRTISLFEQNGLNVLLNEKAGLKTVCIAKKSNRDSRQEQTNLSSQEAKKAELVVMPGEKQNGNKEAISARYKELVRVIYKLISQKDYANNPLALEKDLLLLRRLLDYGVIANEKLPILDEDARKAILGEFHLWLNPMLDILHQAFMRRFADGDINRAAQYVYENRHSTSISWEQMVECRDTIIDKLSPKKKSLSEKMHGIPLLKSLAQRLTSQKDPGILPSIQPLETNEELRKLLQAGAGQMKHIGPHDPLDENANSGPLSKRNGEFESLASSILIENVYDVSARVITADLGNTGAYHFYSLALGLIIVVNSKYNSQIRKEGKYHEVREIYWMGKGFGQHEAHVIASAEQEQVKEFKGGGGITNYHRQQLEDMSNEELKAIINEDGSVRQGHHVILEKANSMGAGIDIGAVRKYEENLRQEAKGSLDSKNERDQSGRQVEAGVMRGQDFVVADQSKPPFLGDESIPAKRLDISKLPIGTLINYEISNGHWDYTLRIETGGMISIWLRGDRGRIIAPIAKIGTRQLLKDNKTNGIIEEGEIAYEPYFNQSKFGQGERTLESIGIEGIFASPENIRIKLPLGEMYVAGNSRQDFKDDFKNSAYDFFMSTQKHKNKPVSIKQFFIGIGSDTIKRKGLRLGISDKDINKIIKIVLNNKKWKSIEQKIDTLYVALDEEQPDLHNPASGLIPVFKKQGVQDWPYQDYFKIVEKFGSAFSETLSEKEEKQLGLDFIGMHRWFGTNEDDWASTLGRMKNRKGVYLGVGYSGVNLSRLCHGDFDLAIILDVNPYVTEVFMPIRAALISMSNSRAEYLSILAGVKFNDDELADLKEASLEEIYQAVLRKTNRVIEPELTTGKLRQAVWARIEKQFSREATKKSAREFWNKYSDIFFGLGRMVKTMVVPDEIKVEDSIKGRESWLANEDNFNKIKKMTQEGRILGITGSLLDPRKMNRVASYLEERNLKVSVVYISNIPEWLNRESDMEKRKQNFQILSQNIELLPTKEAVLMTHGLKSRIREIPDKKMLPDAEEKFSRETLRSI